jgi:hypothetical protein
LLGGCLDWFRGELGSIVRAVVEWLHPTQLEHASSSVRIARAPALLRDAPFESALADGG